MAGISRQIGWSQESNLLYYILQQLTKLTSVIFNLKPKYKVFTALLYQSGDGSKGSQNSGPLTKGITYKISGSDGDYSNVGAPNNDDGTQFIAINNEVPNSYGTGKLNYIIGAPVANILENTIGDVWFEYLDVGYYSMKSDSLFTENKTTLTISGSKQIDSDLPTSNISFGYDVSSLRFLSIEPDGTLVNDGLTNTVIEIRVYN